MLWILLLFPSNMKAATKKFQVLELWDSSGSALKPNEWALAEEVMTGIGSGGPAFNNYRPDELAFLIELTRAVKQLNRTEREALFADYQKFTSWIASSPMQGNRQFRHMLRYFAFPDLVERISSNNDRYSILESFGVASKRETAEWSDEQLDRSLLELRQKLEQQYPIAPLDFYGSPLKERWCADRTIKTPDGPISVTVPDKDEEQADDAPASLPSDVRQSIQIQTKLAYIGARMNFKVWIARADRQRVSALLGASEQQALIQELPLNYDTTTVDTIELIDVIWISGRAMVRAFEVEHTTAVYSGLLRMADLLALQPNMDIRLHIVAPVDRRDKVFREIRRPVFALFGGRPLSNRCTFISYEGVEALSKLEHLPYVRDNILEQYEEPTES
jgi:hypothetical protein